MKLLIDIDENTYRQAKEENDYEVIYNGYEIARAIIKGIPYDERPQGEWITFPTNHSIIQCPECTALLNNLRADVFKDKIGKMNYCPNCGADMRKPNCVTCDHFGKCGGCERSGEE